MYRLKLRIRFGKKRGFCRAHAACGGAPGLCPATRTLFHAHF
jgi:hypothetical protein